MNLENDSAEHYEYIGDYLKALREHYGLSYQDITDQLRIRTRYVEAIEHKRMEDLPGRVYTLGYLQAYAEFLGVNPQTAATLFETQCGLAKEEDVFVVGEPPAPSSFPEAAMRVITIMVIVAAIAAGIYQYAGHVGDNVAAPTVDEVPARLLTSAFSSREWVKNSACGAADIGVWPPCFYRWDLPRATLMPQTVSHPLQRLDNGL